MGVLTHIYIIQVCLSSKFQHNFIINIVEEVLFPNDSQAHNVCVPVGKTYKKNYYLIHTRHVPIFDSFFPAIYFLNDSFIAISFITICTSGILLFSFTSTEISLTITSTDTPSSILAFI